jgi:PAS domain S-box-containing protein
MTSCPVGVNTAIVTIDESGTIQSVDRGCCKLFGYEMPELCGKQVTILIPTPYKEQHSTYISNYHDTGNPHVIGLNRSLEAQHKDGTIFQIRLSVSEMKTPLGTIYIGIIEPIEDKTAIITSKATGEIISVNAHCDLWGYEPTSLIGKNVSMLMPEPYSSQHESFISEYLQTGHKKAIGLVRNLPARHKNGNVFPICLRVESFFVDGEEFFKASIEEVQLDQEVVFSLNQSGTILSCNKTFIRPLTGYTDNELINRHINTLVPGLFSTISNPSNLQCIKRVDRSNEDSSPPSATEDSSPGFQTSTTSAEEISEADLLNSRTKRARRPSLTLEDKPSPKIPRCCGYQDVHSSSSEQSDRSVENGHGWLDSEVDVLESWRVKGTQNVSCIHKDGSKFLISLTVKKFIDVKEQIFYSVRIKRTASGADFNSIYGTVMSSPCFSEPAVRELKLIGNGRYSISNSSLGTGAYGKVRLGKNILTGQSVAIKILQKDVLDHTDILRALREIEILKQLNHPNICRLDEVIFSIVFIIIS